MSITIHQLSLFLENRFGTLNEICQVLKENNGSNVISALLPVSVSMSN